MAISYNPETGAAHFWDGNDWVPTKVSKNPQTGAAHVWDGQNWEPIKSTEPAKENLLSDIYGFGKKGVGEGISGIGWLADKATGYGGAMQEYGRGVTEAAEAAISPEAKERAGRELISEAEPGKGMFGYQFNPSALAGLPYQAAESIPGMVAGIGTAALATALAPEVATAALGATALRVLGPFGLRAATAALGDAGVAAATAAGKNVIEAAAPVVGKAVFATLAGNASEGLQAAGMNGEQTETTILATLRADPSLLQRTRAGQEALQETGGDVEAAIKVAAAKASGKVAWQTGLSTSLLATPGSAFEARMLQGGLKKGALREAGLGAFSEGILQEAPQSAAEQYIQNVAQGVYDPSITPGQGVLNAAVQGGILGGALGGGAGVISNAVSGKAPDQDFIDRMGRRVSSEELNTAIGDVRRDAIARNAAAFNPEAIPENIDLVSDAVIEGYKQQGMSDQEIADVYPPYAEAMNRRAAEFAAQQDAMREGIPGLETVDTPSYTLPEGMTVTEPTVQPQAAPKPKPQIGAKIVDATKDLLERRPEEDAAISEGMALRPGEYSARGGTPEVASFVDNTFSFDNPAVKRGDTSWLEAKQQIAEQDMQEQPAETMGGKGLTGSVTGWNSDPIDLPTPMLADVQGANDEQPAPGNPKYDRLVKSVEENGWNPTPIKVRINHRGVPYIAEGNTRAAVARDMGFPTVPAKIEWMNGAELSDSQWSPQGVSERVMSAAPAQEERSVRGGIDLTPFEGLPLPKTLAGAKPRYKTLQLNFKNDLAKALYIAKDKPESNAYHKWLVKSGVPAEAIPTLGQAVTNHIRGIADAQTTNAPIEVGAEALAAPAKKTTARKPKAPSATAPQAAPEPAPAPKRKPKAKAEPVVEEEEAAAEAAPEEEVAPSEEELAFEEEIAPTKRRKAREAEKAEEGPPDAERLKRSREIVNTFLKAMEARGEAGKTAAQAARRALFGNDVSHAEVHHLFIAHDIASRILGGTGANPTLAYVRKVAYDARRLRAGTKEGGIRGLIEFSLDPGGLPYLRETAYHEAFHVIQDLMQQYDPKTASLVFGAFKDGMTLKDVDASIRRTLQMASPEKGGPSYWDIFTKQYTADTNAGADLRSEFGKQREAMAYMFGMLADAKAQGHNVNTLSAPFKRFLNFMSQLRQRMGNYLRGQGYRSLQDVLNDYATGKAQKGYGAEVPVSGETEPEYSFVGKGAKNWPQALQDEAEKIEEDGGSPEDVWMKTGLHRGLRDRQWRYEVPDAYAKFDPNGLKRLANREKVDLSDLIEHPELFSNYPSFMASEISARSDIGPGEAYFFRQRGVNYIGLSLQDAKALNSGVENDMMQSLLHEIQHGIQESEGFAKGIDTKASTIKIVAERVERAARETLDDPRHLAAKAVRGIAAKRLGQTAYETTMDDWHSEVQHAFDRIEGKYGIRIIDDGFFAPPRNIVRLGVYMPSALTEAEKNGIGFYVRQTPDAENGFNYFRKVTKDEKAAVMAELLSDPDLKAASEIFGALKTMQKDLDAKIASWKKEYSKEQKSLAVTMKKLRNPPAAPTYRGEPGERESRDTELRSKLMSAEERRAQLPGALMPYKGFKAEGSLDDIINKPAYAKAALAKMKEVIKEALPDEGEFSKRGGATAPPVIPPAIQNHPIPAAPKILQTAKYKDFKDLPIIDMKDYIGEKAFFIFADLTEATGYYTGIDGSRVKDPERLLGGPGYPLLTESQMHQLAWACDKTQAISTKLNKGAKYVIVAAMSPGSHQSNRTFTMSLAKTIKAYMVDKKISPAQVQSLNEIIRKGVAKDFPGFESSKLFPWLKEASFNLRSEIANKMDTDTARNLGAPNVEKLRRALLAKDFAGVQKNHGILMLEIPTGDEKSIIHLGQNNTPLHPSYQYGLPGKIVGRFATTVDPEFIQREWFAETNRKIAEMRAAGEKKIPTKESWYYTQGPVFDISPEMADRFPTEEKDIQSTKAGRVALSTALNQWKSSDDDDGKGVDVSEFIYELAASDASTSLTDYGWDEVKGERIKPLVNVKRMIKSGELKLFKLADAKVYFGIKTSRNNETGEVTKTLVSVVNNEPGAKGVGGPAVVLKAIQEGVTDLDCYGVPSAAYPNGFLNDFYSAFGFQEVDRYPFDEKYVKDPQFGGSENKLRDLRYFWEQSNWDKSMGNPPLVIMKWMGDDADRQDILRKYLLASRKVDQPGNSAPDVGGAAGAVELVPEEAGGQRGESDGRGGAGSVSNGRPARPTDRFRRTLISTLKLNEKEALILGLDPDTIAAARAELPEVDQFSKRGGDPVFVRTYKDLRESARSRADWRDWYDRHDKLLRDTFGDDAELFQTILSATSQAASVAANVGLALKAYRQLKSNANQFEGFLPAVIKNLERIRSDEALRGAKISEYGKASAGDEAGIAVDRHIAMIMFGKKAPNAREIAIAKEWIRDIAKDLGWKPREVQAALWAANQVIQGKDPADVRSYDYYLNRKASQIAALRSAFDDTGGAAGSVRESGKAVQSGEERSQRGGVEAKAHVAGNDPSVPSILYHGTTSKIDEFRSNIRKGQQLGFGFHLAQDAEFANRYATDENVARKGKSPTVYPVRASIKNPLLADTIVVEGSPEFELAKKLAGKKFYSTKNAEGIPAVYLQNTIDATSPERAQRLIQEAGYDGVRYKANLIEVGPAGVGYTTTGTSTSWVVFDPVNQLIPAFGGAELSKRGGVEEGEKAVGRAIRAAGANAITNGGKVKRFLKSVFDPLAELPEREQYLLMRYKTLGNVSALEREARGFYEIMKKATDLQKKQIYAYLTTRGAVAPALPPELRTVAMQVKNRINQIGAELVARRIVSPQSVAMYKDKYLPRLYMKYLLEDKGIAGAGIGVGSQDYVKERKSIGAEERVAMGEVTEPSFLSFAALYRPQRDMALLDFLEDVATTSNTDWVMPDQLLDWKGSKVTAFWLSDESKNIRERMLYEPDAGKRVIMERVANQMQALADPHLNNLVTENYKRLPKSNRYGALKGLAVRKEIYNDLIAAGGFDPDPSFIDKVFGDKNSSLARGTQFWKMTKTILNPPTQVRNFISNAVMLNLSGVPIYKVVPRMLQAITAMQKNSYAWKVAQEYGIDAGGFGENELRDAKEVLQEFLDQNVTGVMNPKQVGVLLGKITQIMGNAYQWSEMVFKTAKIIDELERKGVEQMPAGPAKTKAEGLAALEGHKWFFDYSLVPRSIKSLRTMPFGAPFITYYYKALPLLAEVAMNPKTAMRFAPYIALQMALPLLVASLYDVDEDDVEKLKNSMSEQLREKPGMLIIPFKDEKDRWQFLDAGYFFPWTMFLTTIKSVAKGDVSGALGSVGALSSPALSAAVAIKTNIDPFSGRQIVNPIDPPFDQMKSLLNYVNSLVSPPFLTSYGIVGKAIEAAQGSGTNRYGEPNMTATQIALRGIGFNVTPLIPELQRARNIEHLKNQLTLLKGRENQAVRDRSIGTVEERIAIRDRYREERTRLQEKIQQYIKDTELHPNLRTKTDGETP